MASVIVSEIGIAPWTFGLGLAAATSGSTLETIGGSTPDIIDQLFKYQTFLKKCEDAMTAQGLEVFKPIGTIVNAYTARYTPTNRNAFKMIPMDEFTPVTANWGMHFTTLWQRFYEYSPSTGGKLYVRLDFGIMGKPQSTTSDRAFYEMSGYRVVVAKTIGANNVEQVIGERYFPHIASTGSSGYMHSKINASTDFYFCASKYSVFFSFGGYRLARSGYLDGRLDSATVPATLHCGPIFTPFNVYNAEVPTTVEPGVYFPPKLLSSADSTPTSPMTAANPTGVVATSSSSGALCKFILPSGVFETAFCGVLASEVRTTSTAGRVFGMPFSMVVNNGMIVARELVLMIDPNISSFGVEFLPFFIGANKKTVAKLPCIAQNLVGAIAYNYATDVSIRAGESARATGQTVFGVLLDETPVYY